MFKDSIRTGFLLIFLSSFSGKIAGAHQTTEDLKWLSGTWVGVAEAIKGDLQFLTPAGGIILGANRLVVGGKLSFAEFVRITDTDKGLVLSPTPLFLLDSGKVGVSFGMKEFSQKKVVFENPEHDFPRTITYELKEGSLLTVRVEGKKEGFPPIFETLYKRQAN